MEHFYRPRLQSSAIGFPDLYVIFCASVNELKQRKEKDTDRRRGNFAKHLQMIEPQKRYFEAMKAFAPNRVLFLATENLQSSVDSILNINDSFVENDNMNYVDLFDKMIVWLK
jgi:hypothetical protein